MHSTHAILFLLAFICFVIAGIPNKYITLRLEWFGFAALVLTQII